jgi:hypothetical protein
VRKCPDFNALICTSGGGFPKKVETFIFFRIADPKDFVDDLEDLIPLIKTVKGILKDRDDIKKHKDDKKPGLLEMVGVNIALTYTGLRAVSCSLSLDIIVAHYICSRLVSLMIRWPGHR